MRNFSPTHPKAQIMARKRTDILAAAKASFLATGYEGTSMESIAKVANVSIMTLYRHARTKNDLFCAVIANACDPSDESERAEMEMLLAKPFADSLVAAAMKAQRRLVDPDTIALMRTVIAGAARFPMLAELAHKGLVGGLVEMIDFILGCKSESAHLDASARRAMAQQFVDGLVGTGMLGVLMGLRVPSDDVLRQRAVAVSAMLIAEVAEKPV